MSFLINTVIMHDSNLKYLIQPKKSLNRVTPFNKLVEIYKSFSITKHYSIKIKLSSIAQSTG